MSQTYYANLANDRLIVIEQLQKDVADLNRLLRDVGWGQGEIDTAAVTAEENEQLRAALRKLVDAARKSEWNGVYRDETGSAPACVCCNRPAFDGHKKTCTYAAAIAEAERLLGDYK